MSEPTTDDKAQDNAERLRALVEAVNPEGEALPEDLGVRLAALEEGFAVLIKEAGKVMHGLRAEHRMREERPNGPTGEGWDQAFGTLAGYEAGMLWVQAKGLVKLGRDEAMQKVMHTEHKRLVNIWGAMIEPLEGAYKRRNDLEGMDERTEQWIEQCLKTMKRSFTVYKRLAKNRARRLGPKQAALARLNAEQVRRKMRQVQRQLMAAAAEGVASVEEGTGQERSGEAQEPEGSER